MKPIVFAILAIISLCITNLAFAERENPVYAARPHFPQSIKAGERADFSAKIINVGPSKISNIKSTLEVNPKSASTFVHIQVNQTADTLWVGNSDTIYGTIYVDRGIPVQIIYVTVSFTGMNSRGEEIRMTNLNSNAMIKIEKPAKLGSSSMIDVKVQPQIPKIGQQLTIKATLQNDYPYPIYVEQGVCSPKSKILFTTSFDDKVRIEQKNPNCAGSVLIQRINPDEKITRTSPESGTKYIAQRSGTANATVSFSYYTDDKSDSPRESKKISKQFSFTISEPKSKLQREVKILSISPKNVTLPEPKPKPVHPGSLIEE